MTKDTILFLAEKAKDLTVPEQIRDSVERQEAMHPAKPLYYRFFYHIATSLKPKLCVELGTNRGVAAACLAIGNQEGRVVTIDIAKKDIFPGCNIPNIDFWIQDSMDQPKEDLKDIDILFIDTSSKGSQNQREYDFWIDRVKQNGIVFIDDIFIVKDHKGEITTDRMAEFWQKFKPEGEKIELALHSENGFGMVLLNKKSHINLKNRYKGEDIYVLGSGMTMEYIDPDFFTNKITIGANSIWKFFKVKYSLFKHKQFIEEASKNGQVVIASKHDCGDIDKEIIDNKNVDYIFTHKRGRFGDLEDNFQENLDAVGKDNDIFVSYSTITSCIHLAAYMGAKNIIICGHDCGYLDDKSHTRDYAKHIVDFYKRDGAFNDYYNNWFDQTNKDTIALKAKIKEIYNCNIYSLNPFINFRLEGHKYVTKK